MSTRTFNVTGFTLPVQMVFSMAQGAAAQVPGIAPTAGAASGFVMRVVMQAVFDVLERQGRAAGLSDPIIQIILGQLTVSINYQPLECKDVEVNQANPAANIQIMGMMMPKCIIIGNAVTAICNMNCMLNNANNMLFGCSSPALVNFRNAHDHKPDHGELVERDVARRGEQSGSNLGLGSVRIEFLLGSGHRLMKRETHRQFLGMNKPFM